ncbi:MAG: TrkH family potassium uptake protein [Bacteroidetes bacterium]|jgi:trk system potassium uptake protein TrkH|nr:TrkH family potassium uptake protein [Bacteroidota bacterium]
MKSFLRKINFAIILRIIGFLLIIEGLFMLTALPFTYLYCDLECTAIPVSAFITIFVGGMMFLINRKAVPNLGKREGYIIVSFTWILISLFGSLPYYISGTIPSFTDAFFETISGFTTTGATILTDIESMPRDLLYWRSLTHWLGGMGIIVFTVAILPILGIGGMQLFMAEMPGVTYDKLHPRITATAKRLWGIYVLLTALQTLLLWAGEMDFFDAINHAYATMATGGFSTRNDSIAAFSSYSQYIIIIFMILAGTNFTLHYFALHGKLSRVFKDEEYRGYITIVGVFVLLISIGLLIAKSGGLEVVFRDSLFTVVSILTTTGFATVNYMMWPTILWMLVFVLMFIGGSAGSTGGGMKIVRQLLLLKNSRMELKRAIHPNAVLPVRFNQKSVPQDTIYKVMAFFLMYILIFSMGMLALSALGLDFQTAVGASIASLGNIGPGIGNVGPVDNYAFMPLMAKWLLTFMMLLGRLEIFTVLILFSPQFWKR